HLHRCRHLLVRFRNGPPSQLPDAPIPEALPQTTPDLPPVAPSVGTGNTPGKAEAGKKAEPRQPIDLEADDVSAYVVRTGAKNAVEEVVAVDPFRGIHVHQEAAKPGEKGIDIRGDTLDLIHDPQGDLLIVLGDPRDGAAERKAAWLQLKELVLV